MNDDGQGSVASQAVDLQAAFHQFSVEHMLLTGKIALKSCIVIGVISKLYGSFVDTITFSICWHQARLL